MHVQTVGIGVSAISGLGEGEMEKGTAKHCKICGKYTYNNSELCSEHQYREGNCWVYDEESDRWIQKFRDDKHDENSE